LNVVNNGTISINEGCFYRNVVSGPGLVQIGFGSVLVSNERNFEGANSVLISQCDQIFLKDTKKCTYFDGIQCSLNLKTHIASDVVHYISLGLLTLSAMMVATSTFLFY